ncbi:16S rRNA (guanine1516-N2)-methyltransferase [Pseudidiomarina planktonica]|uniref:Ribosomal RNA small subunit methyltransferase J n=1 Tax=Pseudidiomarina planktonica TaxID=1323738 RepID=A0A1Y6FVU1_9GAMM|nr:class I SAM-dependent methyltransferase [Pseudidiomarina planktonica]RUO64018.1 16S rRNA methyltransferase [Pseudidiomarina planktonica]SMQ79888.1 16S rRNA (guanine1516-N2)-methyltransferase [Pseudidiomarina planktonica]
MSETGVGVIAVVNTQTDDPELQQQAAAIAEQFQFTTQPHPNAEFQLELSRLGLSLRWLANADMTPLRIDFLHSKHAARAARATIKNEAIARAIGVSGNKRPSVLDATAGLGRDALVLAALGCEVTLQERHPVVAALLQYALQHDGASHPWLQQRLQFGGQHVLQTTPAASFDVVYLDPMYPKGQHKRDRKSAVKKDMQMFHALVGNDEDADALLAPALQAARKRVVVKRPQHADFLAGSKPNQQVISNKQRFDIYLIDAAAPSVNS